MAELRNKRVAIYARYSSQMQREASIEDQVRRCSEFIQRQGGETAPDLVFTDFATSGASLARPGFENLMRHVELKPSRVDVIVTEDMSRISREFADAADVFRRLRYHSVPLVGVADGIDTSSKDAKLSYTIKALLSDMYLDELRDKTLRGLEGRALAGFSTGGLPIGYRSIEEKDQFGRVVGHRILIDEERAAVVRRIFAMYLDGRSLDAIARQLNSEHVEPARKGQYRHKGWVASTVRSILHNTSYIGEWSFKKRQWRKLPGTNVRRPRARLEEEILRTSHFDRRIIDEETWMAVRVRLAEVHACYTKAPDGSAKGRATGRQNNYVLSGLIRCGACGAPMTIHAGTSARYYRCSDQKKRGICTNKLLLREDIARRRILGALAERFRRPAALAYMRKRVAERLGELSRNANSELAERRARIERVEQKIAGLIDFIAQGERSEYIVSTLRDYENQAKAERAAIARLRDHAAAEVVLPSPDAVVAKALDLERLLEVDPVRGREQLKRLFEGGRLLLHPQPEGHYVAESRFFPLALLSLDAAQKPKARNGEVPGFQVLSDSKNAGLCSSDSCAGRI